jgi:hypothetical protein
MSLQAEQLNAEIETKTKDNVFVRLNLAVQYKVGATVQRVHAQQEPSPLLGDRVARRG